MSEPNNNASLVVFKYEADRAGVFLVPYGDAKPVHLEWTDEDEVWPTLWVLVDTDSNGFTQYGCVGTGHPLKPGSIIHMSAVCGDYVWHLCTWGE